MKPLPIIAFLFLAFPLFSQQDNILHERKFWAENPNVATVQQMVREGHNATALNHNGFDATTFALISKTNSEVIKYLLSMEGNPINKRTHDGRIYLHWATSGGNPESIKMLLDLGSAMDARDSRGNTPLTFAAGSGLTDTGVYDLFRSLGIDLADEKNEQGANLLLLAAPYLKNEDDLAYFVDNGILLEGTDYEGNGIFNYASRRGNIELLKTLVNKGLDYQSPNKNGGNAFMFAAQGTRGFNNSIGVYEYLKSLSLDPTITTHDGTTPFHRVSNSKVDISVIDFFLNEGADVDQKDADGNTPFLNACSRNSIEIVKRMAQHSKNLNNTNEKGQSALMLAVANNTPEVVGFLIDQGLNIDLLDEQGNSLAFYLIESYNHRNLQAFDQKLDFLIEKGLKLDAIQAEGNSIYHLAANKDDLALMERLTKFNIAINAVNTEGMTALHQAALKAKDTKVMELLVSLGCDIKATTEFGETAFDLASENEQLQNKNTALKFLN